MHSQPQEWTFWNEYAGRYNRFIRHVRRSYGEMIREASRALEKEPRTNLRFSVRDGYSTGFDDESFDLVVISNVMHVVDQPAALLAEAGRVVKIDGAIILATYCHGTSSLTRMVSWIMSLRGFEARHKWSPLGFRQFLEASGYEVREETIIKDIIPLAVEVVGKH